MNTDHLPAPQSPFESPLPSFAKSQSPLPSFAKSQPLLPSFAKRGWGRFHYSKVFSTSEIVPTVFSFLSRLSCTLSANSRISGILVFTVTIFCQFT